ncbi:hypothetical protein DAEQUDRAFT_731314 [Daedalea quercina L-15889]|uniref:Uncharacterized protein n=1 Tax=Daedalea quercina L-15889 TaxID=1314783 RepID=A0A165MCN2_9APHY|nr:hypothetical protein DAEQUDRAFT_731314 [Daedalea quercina L-15889]
MALHLHPMLSVAAGRSSHPRITSNNSTIRAQRAFPSAPVRDLGARALQRLINIKRDEQEQEREDLKALGMTEEERLSLEQSFASVKFEAADLDGLSWATPSAQHMLAQWYKAQVLALRRQFGMPDDSNPAPGDEDADPEPPLSSASDHTIIPDDVPTVDVEPPSPPPTANLSRHPAPPPLVWPPLARAHGTAEHVEALSPSELHAPLSPLSPGSLRWHHRTPRARRTPTHRVFSLPACAGPQRIALQRLETVRPGEGTLTLTSAKTGAGTGTKAGKGPKPLVRQLTIDPRPPGCVSPPIPDSPTLGRPVVPSPAQQALQKKRVVSMPTELAGFPVPPPLARALGERHSPTAGCVSPALSLVERVRARRARCPSGATITPAEPHADSESATHHSDSEDPPTGRQDPFAGLKLPEVERARPDPGAPDAHGRASGLAGLKIALPGLDRLPLLERTMSVWGGRVTPEEEEGALPPLERAGSVLGFCRGEGEGEGEGGGVGGGWMPGGLSPEMTM